MCQGDFFPVLYAAVSFGMKYGGISFRNNVFTCFASGYKGSPFVALYLFIIKMYVKGKNLHYRKPLFGGVLVKKSV